MKLIFTKKPVIFGLLSSIVLLEFYFILLTATNSFAYTIWQIGQIWYWILFLVIGFGTQAGLYFSIREAQKKISVKPLAASGGISAGSMVACCLHHLADLLPFIGLAGAALFLIQYQIFFLLLGSLFNIVGIIIMLEIIQKNQLFADNPVVKKTSACNLAMIKKVFILISSILLIFVYFYISGQDNFKGSKEYNFTQDINLSSKNVLASQTNSQSGISFEVTPLEFNFDNPVRFDVEITTHSGSLDFDPAKISTIKNSEGDQFAADEWKGSPAGGHHRSGVLVFPKLSAQTKILTLIIDDGNQRIFEWEL